MALLSAALFLVLNVVVACIVLKVVFWLLREFLTIDMPWDIQRLFYAIVALWFIASLLMLLTGGGQLFYSPYRPVLR